MTDKQYQNQEIKEEKQNLLSDNKKQDDGLEPLTLAKLDTESQKPVVPEKPQSGFQKLKGQFYMFIATIVSSLVFINSKILFKSSSITPYEVNYWVAIQLMVLQFFALSYNKVNIFYIEPACRKGILFRMMFGYISNASLYAALKMLSMSQATLLFWTQPIFVGVFGYAILKEKFTKFDVLGICFVFLGVVLVSNPFEEAQDSQEYPNQALGIFFALLGAIMSALAMISIRSLGGKIDPLLMTMYWALGNALFAPLNLGIKIAKEEMTTEYGWFEFMMIELNLICMFGYMQLQTLAYVTDKAVRIAPVQSQMHYN
eukprot:403375150